MAVTLKVTEIDDLTYHHERRGTAGWSGKAQITVSGELAGVVLSLPFYVPFHRAETLEAGMHSALDALAGLARELADEASRQARAIAAGRQEEKG